ncbi:MAG: ribonuclease III [Alphaproteobacteria bacterium]|nr:ribonuclease III [Alphaproteobacteria bacterium]
MAETKPSEQDWQVFAERLGHSFKQKSLLQGALTHPSLGGGGARRKSAGTLYERLEFLGDRVLGLTVAAWLYQQFPDDSEGDLSKRHAALVNRVTLKKIAVAIDLPRFLRVAKGEQAATQRSQSVLSDAIEALIGALYLDGGVEMAQKFIHRHWQEALAAQKQAAQLADPKTVLQEWAQGRGLPLPVYKVLSREGPAHAPKFIIEVTVQGYAPAQAEGEAKREAEKKAAAVLLANLVKANP